jgi:hypothetical protein
MADKIEKEIEQLLAEGRKKPQIWKQLRKGEKPYKALFFLNNAAKPEDRRKYQILNLFLALILGFITFKKLLTALSFGSLDIFLLLGLVVPIINIYVLREILRFHRLGYRFLFVLSCLSLLQPENHHLQEIIFILLMIAASGYLHLQMFPGKEQISID